MQKKHQTMILSQNWMARVLLVAAFLLGLALFTQPVQAATPKAEKEWTFLLFLNGHNNLDSYGAFNINQMEEVGSNDQLNMVVQWASLKNKKTQRLLVQKDNDKNKVTSPAVETLAPVDMGDYKQLVEFVRWGVKNYPAKKYMIAVWNHGNGWYRLGNVNARDISYDDITGNRITTEQLGVAMTQSAEIMGHKVDVYGSDACLMAMAEVAGEMKDSVHMFVGSEDLEPGYGWPYSTWMQRWASANKPSAKDVSIFLTEEYIKSYDGGIYGNQDVTYSAMDLSKFDGFMNAMKNLNTSLTSLAPADMVAVRTAVNNATNFYMNDYRDLGQFTEGLANSKLNINKNILAEVSDALSEVVVAKDGTGTFEGVSGMSIWLPTSTYDLNKHSDRYEKLAFNQGTSWLSFLKSLSK